MTIDTNKARERSARLAQLGNEHALDELTEAAALLLQLADAHDRMLPLLVRYRNETPLGHQPHMIAHEADAAIDAAMGADQRGKE